MFLRYFKSGLTQLIKSQRDEIAVRDNKTPEELAVNHIASTFVETVRWWVENRMKEKPEQIHTYFTELIKDI